MKINKDTVFTRFDISKYKALATVNGLLFAVRNFVGALVLPAVSGHHEKLQIVYANIRV